MPSSAARLAKFRGEASKARARGEFVPYVPPKGLQKADPNSRRSQTKAEQIRLDEERARETLEQPTQENEDTKRSSHTARIKISGALSAINFERQKEGKSPLDFMPEETAAAAAAAPTPSPSPSPSSSPKAKGKGKEREVAPEMKVEEPSD